MLLELSLKDASKLRLDIEETGISFNSSAPACAFMGGWIYWSLSYSSDHSLGLFCLNSDRPRLKSKYLLLQAFAKARLVNIGGVADIDVPTRIPRFYS